MPRPSNRISSAQFKATLGKRKPASYATRNQDSKRYHRQFLMQCKAHGLPAPVTEYKFHATRRWRFDFAWFDERADIYIAVEIEGGLYVAGGHSRGAAYEKNLEKYNEATRLGWELYRFSTGQVANGSAIAFLKKVFKL